eukprot:293848_1
MHNFALTWFLLINHYTFVSNTYYKSVSLTPSNPQQQGASVKILQPNQVNTDNTHWHLYATDNIGFHIVVSLDKSWGFHPNVWSSIVFAINSDTSLPSDGLDLIISPSVNDTQYITALLNMDYTWTKGNEIFPPVCDSYNKFDPEFDILANGNVRNLVAKDTGDTRLNKATDGGDTINMKPSNHNKGYDNHWPLRLTFENDIDAGIVSFVYSTPLWGAFEQVCCFNAFETNKGMDLYFSVDEVPEKVSITAISVFYQAAINTSNPTIN